MTPPSDPFSEPIPPEVSLARAPLIRVVAQLRFPVIASIEKQEFIASFQEAIRTDYPVLRAEQSQSVTFSMKGPVQTKENTAWRFHDLEENWRVSLSTEFVALETTAYRSRGDFLGRLEQIVNAAAEHLDPKVCSRIGIRYIDRVENADAGDIRTMIREEVAGVLSSPLGRRAHVAVCESVFSISEDGQIRARWGMIPGGSTIDPLAIEPVADPSWVLDLDAFEQKQQPFDSVVILARARELAEANYKLFRWAVTGEFIRRYGGEA